jgi:hypothetical protein
MELVGEGHQKCPLHSWSCTAHRRREKGEIRGKSTTCIASFYFMFCLQMQHQCLHMRQQSAPSPQQLQQLVGESNLWRRKKSEKNQLWFRNTNRVLAEYRHGLWLYTSLSCDSGCCRHPLLKSSLEMRQQQSHKPSPTPSLQPALQFCLIPVNTLAASTLILLFSENLLECSNFVFLNLNKILWPG